MKKFDNSSVRWDKEVLNYLDEYHKSIPKHGIVIQNFINKSKNYPKKILEIGAFSCKDSRYLAIQNKSCKVYSVDISSEAVKSAKLISKKLNIKNHFVTRMDAFNLKFKDKEFDITFHSGFFIYFNNNSDINKLLAEQKRITRGHIIIFVHNKYSLLDRIKFFINWFILNKSLYKIRWWSIKEIEKTCSSYGKIVEEGSIKNWLISVLKYFVKKDLSIIENKLKFMNSFVFKRVIYVILKVS